MDVQLARLRRPNGTSSSDAADFDEICQLMRAALPRVPLSFLERHLEEKNVITMLLRAQRANGGVPDASGSTSRSYTSTLLRGLQPVDVIIDDEHDEVWHGLHCLTFESTQRRQPAEPLSLCIFITIPILNENFPCMTLCTPDLCAGSYKNASRLTLLLCRC